MTRFDVGSEIAFGFPIDCEEAVEQKSNLGCEFWAVDLPNDGRGTELSPPAADQQFAVAVANPSGLADAQVEIYTPDETLPVAAATVPPGEAQTIPLPSLSIDPNATTAAGRAYRIVSSVPITAYQFNPLDNVVQVYSNDASLLIPTHALGTDYTAITGDAVFLSMGPQDPMPVNAGAFISVVATVDDTEVEIDPVATIVGRLDDTVTLDRGRVLTILSNADLGPGNLSGTRVRAGEPVAAFSGNVATAVPTISLGAQGGYCCADHLEQQLTPHSAWGSAYVVAPPAEPIQGGDGDGDNPAEYRIVGAFDDTELIYCPERPRGAPVEIDAGQVVTFTTEDPFTVWSSDSDKTFAIAQFLMSFEAIDSQQLGDPSLLIVPAAEQFQQLYIFVIPAGYRENHVTIIRAGTSDVSLDGAILETEAWNDLGILRGVSYQYTQQPVEEGPHLIEGFGRIGLSVFGYDEAVSFAFPGGSGLRVISVPPVG